MQMHQILKGQYQVKRIDVSNSFSDCSGKREIVINIEITEENAGSLIIYPHFLRLNSKDYLEGVTHYSLLKKFLKKNKEIDLDNNQSVVRMPPLIIDFRIQKLAFFQ